MKKSTIMGIAKIESINLLTLEKSIDFIQAPKLQFTEKLVGTLRIRKDKYAYYICDSKLCEAYDLSELLEYIYYSASSDNIEVSIRTAKSFIKVEGELLRIKGNVGLLDYHIVKQGLIEGSAEYATYFNLEDWLFHNTETDVEITICHSCELSEDAKQIIYGLDR